MCLAQGQQRSDAGEVRTRGHSVSSQALYHWATALTERFYASVFFSIDNSQATPIPVPKARNYVKPRYSQKI